VIAETGAGQHGVATATICARYGLECVVYMGSEDVKRQSPNVYRMKLLGATVVPVESGSRTLKDALNEALRDWVTNVENTFYIIGTVAGPHPYPMMVRDFQSVIGEECIAQMPTMHQVRNRMRSLLALGVAVTRWVSSIPTFPSRKRVSLAWKRLAKAGERSPFCIATKRRAWRIAWQPHLHLARQQRADYGNAQHQRWLGLPRRRA
jgi:hypothetical protein